MDRGLRVRALGIGLWIASASVLMHGQDDARLGARRYMEYCAGCHGTDARGGAKGPSLTSSAAVNRSDSELSATVRNGSRGGMPPFAQIGDANIQALIHFLRLLQGAGSANTPHQPPGDAGAGRALYFGKAQCSACHMMNGQGGFIARSLTHFARNRTPDAIRAVILNPDNPLIPSTQVVAVTTRAGEKLTGVLRNEDAFSLDLQTEDGRYHMLSRSDLMHIEYSGHSLMPRDYGTRLTPTELNDIVSFLMAAGKNEPSSEERDR